jgi:four helix bundle protein
MAIWKKFEDIEAWQKSRALSEMIYSIIKNTPLLQDFELSKQMKRSSGSVMDNIAEGFERGGTKEFIYFLGISKGSSAELRSQLYRCLDQNYITKDQFNDYYKLTTEISKMISGIVSYLKQRDFKGYKFHEDPEEYQKGNK